MVSELSLLSLRGFQHHIESLQFSTQRNGSKEILRLHPMSLYVKFRKEMEGTGIEMQLVPAFLNLQKDLKAIKWLPLFNDDDYPHHLRTAEWQGTPAKDAQWGIKLSPLNYPAVN